MVFMLLRAHYERARSNAAVGGQKAGSSLAPGGITALTDVVFCRGKEVAVHLLNKNEQRTRWLAWRP
jgi:hypothetical protein